MKKLKQQEAEARRREEHLKAQRRAMVGASTCKKTQIQNHAMKRRREGDRERKSKLERNRAREEKMAN